MGMVHRYAKLLLESMALSALLATAPSCGSAPSDEPRASLSDAPNSSQTEDPKPEPVAQGLLDTYQSMADNGFFTHHFANPSNDDISAYHNNIVPELNKYLDDAWNSSSEKKKQGGRVVYEAYTTDPSTLENQVASENLSAFQQDLERAFGSDAGKFMDLLNSSEGVYFGQDVGGKMGMAIIQDDQGQDYSLMLVQGVDDDGQFALMAHIADLNDIDNQKYGDAVASFIAAFTRQ